MNYLVHKYPTGEYVGRDWNSGGYPFRTETLQTAYMLPDTERGRTEMNKYGQICYRDNLELFSISVTEESVNEEVFTII